jgi:cytochrome c553
LKSLKPFLRFINGAIVNILSISSFCRTGQLLAAMTVCAALAQSAYAGGQSVTSDRQADIDNIATTRINMTQSTAPLDSTKKNRVLNDFAGMCVFCHIPQGANNAASAPKWKNNINYSPATNSSTNSGPRR